MWGRVRVGRWKAETGRGSLQSASPPVFLPSSPTPSTPTHLLVQSHACTSQNVSIVIRHKCFWLAGVMCACVWEGGDKGGRCGKSMLR